MKIDARRPVRTQRHSAEDRPSSDARPAAPRKQVRSAPAAKPAMNAPRSPVVELKPSEIPAGPEVLCRDQLSQDGYVVSIQATRLTGKAVRPEGLTAAAQDVLARYLQSIPRTSFGMVASIIEKDGSAVYKCMGMTLIRMSPPIVDPAKPGVVRRLAVGGLLVPKADQGKAYFEVRVSNDGKDLLVENRLTEYRSPLRGTRANDPFGTFLYENTQLRVHRDAGRAFMKSLLEG